ncbi:tRNA-dihydrouridine synthase [bacterium]|nr:tRNA-dihydrouridine synthase [bacterium]
MSKIKQQPNNRIKNILKSKVSLAPMAGITDYVLRSIIREYSSTCLLTTEMISWDYQEIWYFRVWMNRELQGIMI